MIYYANPSTPTIRERIDAGQLGCIVTPFQGNKYDPTWDVIADNGCFSDRWEPKAWWAWLICQPRTVRFAVCPDVVGSVDWPTHDATRRLWDDIAPKMRAEGFTPAFVCQPGSTPDNVPGDADVLFMGGDNAFKLGPMAASICTRHADRWLHMGRVNSERRCITARTLGCDSVDGTFLTFGPDVNLPKLLGWLDRAEMAPMLREVS